MIDLSQFEEAYVVFKATCRFCHGTGEMKMSKNVIRYDRPKPDGYTYHSEWQNYMTFCTQCETEGSITTILPLAQLLENLGDSVIEQIDEQRFEEGKHSL